MTTKRPEANAHSLQRSQVDKFREAARQLETDDSDERFDATLERLG